MHFTSVLFPAPFSPRIAWKAPGASRSETSSRARRRGAASARSFADRQLAGSAEERVTRRRAPDEEPEGENVRRCVEQVVIRRVPDRLERRTERRGGAEEQRHPEAVDRVPAGEDDERDGHQPLAAREALVPRPGIVEREK